MIKKIPAMLIVGLLITSIVTIIPVSSENIMNITSVEASIFVDDDFNESTPDFGITNFSKIQDAINISVNGDTIFVYNGTYYENVVVNKSISLVGGSNFDTIIDGNYTTYCINVSENDVNISNFLVLDGDVFIDNHSNVILEDIVVIDDIYLLNADNNTIRNCGLLFNGLTLINSNNNSVISCNYSRITLENSDNNTIYDSFVVSVVLGISNDNGIDIAGHNNTISNNTIANWLNGITINGSNNTISENLIGNCDSGMFVEGNNNTISNNTIIYNQVGIHFEQNNRYNSIFGNVIVSNDICGIEFLDDLNNENNTIYHNDFVSNAQHACDSSNNSWNSTFGEGNFWDDYTGVDVDPEDGIGDIPYNISGGENKDFHPLIEPLNYVNIPPYEPYLISGPTSGEIETEYDFTFSAIDPNGNDVCYEIDWGDGEIESVGYHASGEEIILSHSWDSEGTYEVYVKANDTFGADSDFVEILSIEISKPELGLNITIGKLGFCFGKISAELINNGDEDLSDVEWDITVTKGLISREIVSKNGTVETINSGNTASIHTGLNSIKRKFGFITITVTATVDEEIVTETVNAIVIGRIVVFISTISTLI